MYKIITAFLFTCSFAVQYCKAQILLDSTTIDTTTIVQGLHVPWEILWGPDSRVWFTERNGHVSAVNPVTGVKKRMLTIPDVTEQGESGLLGMVLHPGFSDTPHVFLVYNYLSSSVFKEKLVRYTWSPDTLKDPFVLLDNIQANYNHNGSRLVITPDRKIIMSVGDAQAASSAQDQNSLSGKFIRLNLDGSTPSDNPIPGNRIWSWGHRNAQGLVLAPNGKLYSSEHGNSSDDELNLIRPDRNFGWPNVEGFCNLPSEQTFCTNNNVAEPMKAWTPTLAVAGIDYYNHPSIPEWQNCIIMANLKEADMRVLLLDPSGTSILSERIYLNAGLGRLRDVCVSPLGVIYVSTSNQDGRATAGFPKPGDDRIVELKGPAIIPGITKNSVEQQISIFPNPFNNSLELTAGNQLPANTELVIFDFSGREIHRMQINNGESAVVSTESWVSGFYFYQILNTGRISGSGKLLLVR